LQKWQVCFICTTQKTGGNVHEEEADKLEEESRDSMTRDKIYQTLYLYR
jgi:hypothetical protein